MHQGPGDHQPPLEPPGELAHLGVAAVPQIELAQIAFRPHPRLAPRDPVVPRLVQDHLHHRQEEIEVELLGDQAQAALHRLRVAVEVVTEDLHPARGLVDQG